MPIVGIQKATRFITTVRAVYTKHTAAFTLYFNLKLLLLLFFIRFIYTKPVCRLSIQTLTDSILVVVAGVSLVLRPLLCAVFIINYNCKTKNHSALLILFFLYIDFLFCFVRSLRNYVMNYVLVRA